MQHAWFVQVVVWGRDEFQVCCFTEVLSLAASVEFPVCCGLKKLLIMSFGGFLINVISSLLWNLRDISSLRYQWISSNIS